MRLSTTLTLYLGRQFLAGIAIAFLTLTTLILIADIVELSRRAAGRDEASIGVIAGMALMHLPFLAERVVPYAVLLGIMLALVRLTRTNELVVVRAAGVSIWQFMLPGLGLALAIGIAIVTVVNPFASVLLSKYDQLDGEYLRTGGSRLAISSSGLWLREALETGEAVIHARRVTEPGLNLHDVIIFRYEGKDRFVGRIDAATAVLEDGYWRLDNALLTAPEKPAERLESYRIVTTTTLDQVHDSFAAPDTMSFWELPAFIELLERAGFSAVRHRVHWHAVLAGPLLLCGMALIAAAFSLRMTRLGGGGILIASGIGVGLLIYAFSDVSVALGLSGKIPPGLAGWAPAVLATVSGLAMLIHIEDS